MSTSLPRFNPNVPIPNNPFYSPETSFLRGPTGPLIVGSGLTINYSTGVISSSGGGGGSGTVTSITAGAGLTGGVITTAGTIALGNSGVVAGSYSRANVTVDSFGRVTAISATPAPGTVCQVATGTGLTGGPITSTGTVAIANTGVTSGNYTFATIDVNAQGQITNAVSNTAVTSLTAGTGLSGGTITGTGTIALANTGVVPGGYTIPSITVNAQGQVTAISNGVAVTNINTGTGLTGGPITTTGTICLSNTGVTSGTYAFPTVTVDAQGRIGSITAGSAVTSINTGPGLTGGPITSTGNISLATLSPAPTGSYSFSSVSIDQYGRVTNASSADLSTAITGTLPITVTGSATAVTIGVNAATTGNAGVVALTDSTNVNSSTTALTAAQGFSLQQQINALTATSNLTLAGTFDATTSQMLTVTSQGTAAGFAVGANIVAPAVGNIDMFVIVTTGGSYSPPGGGGPFTTSQGDWFLSNGSAWQFLNVGYDEPIATTTNAGIIELATQAEVDTGTDNTKAVTPLTLSSAYVPNVTYTALGDLVVGTGAGTYSNLPVSVTDGAPLVACSTALTGLDYGPVPIAQNILSAKGDLIAGDTTGVPTRFPVGSNGEVLTANSANALGVCWTALTTPIPLACLTNVGALAVGGGVGIATTLASSGNTGDYLTVNTTCTTGLEWCTPVPSIPSCCITAKGTLISGSAANIPLALPVGGNGAILSANSACTTGLEWIVNPAVPCSLLTGKGALISASSLNNPVALASSGLNGDVLTVDTSTISGLAWTTPVPPIPCACINGKGALVTGTGANAPVALTVGSDGQVLTACAASSNGLCWNSPVPAIPCATISGKGDIVIGTASATPGILGPGSNGQILYACSACTEGLCWGPAFVVATPTAAGVILGCTTVSNTALGCSALGNLTSGLLNVGIGTCAGCAISSGSQNVVIGPNATVASPTASCQLAIGFSATCNWLTGDSGKNIQPGAGIRDCAGNLGTASQVLTSTGSALQWQNFSDVGAGINAVAVYTVTGGFAPSGGWPTFAPIVPGVNSVTISVPTNGNPRGWLNTANGRVTPTIPGYYSVMANVVPQPTNGQFFVGIYKNGTVISSNSSGARSTADYAGATATMVVYMNGTTDYLQMGAGTNASPATSFWANYTNFSVSLVGANQILPPSYSVGAWQPDTSFSIGATTTAPAPLNVSQNVMSYRQIGPKDYEVVMKYTKAAGGTAGTGDYLFTLPAGLSFDTSLPWQPAFTGLVSTSSLLWAQYMLAGPTLSQISDGGNITTTTQPVIYDSTRFRLIAHVPGTAIRPWGNGWFTLSNAVYMMARFQFTSP